jgi:metallophosphoesterase superfamily enzyme
MEATIDTQTFTRTLLLKNSIKIEDTAAETLQKRFGIRAATEEAFIMPSFNDFLGGRPVNEARGNKLGSEELIVPVVRSAAVNVGEAELFLLDGTYLGTLNQIKTL